MQIKSLKLVNFRQFVNETIDFAQGEDGRNVTIVLGENGSGKTTLEQSFYWCMYGSSAFSDKILLNRTVAQELLPGKTATVKVILVLRHGEMDYTLTREQHYIKNYNGTVQVNDTDFAVERKTANGTPEYIPESKVSGEVNDILPKQLANYFFFDGERIETMSKEITSDKKVNDFQQAVEGLLGLNAIQSALRHFNPRSKNGVIKVIESQFTSEKNTTLDQLLQEIDTCSNRRSEIQDELDSIASQKKLAETNKREKENEIKTYADGAKLQKEKEKLEKSIADTEETRAEAYNSLFRIFNRDLSSFISLSLIDQAIEFIQSQNLGDIDLPYVRDKTLDVLLGRRECLCGTPLIKGSPAYDRVYKLYGILPPKSLGTVSQEFKQKAIGRINDSENMKTDVDPYFRSISKLNEDIEIHNRELDEVMKHFSGEDVESKVRQLHKGINDCDDMLRKLQDQRDALNQEDGGLQKQIEQAEEKRTTLNADNEKNHLVEVELAYAQAIYKKLNEEYTSEEQKIRKRLQDKINELFKNIYNGEMHLIIKDNYHIDVHDDMYSSGVETSTGQSVSVIFAFISSIIQMARENASKEGTELLSSEVYPLVMDAPLSTFDKTRIDNVCRTLPKIAEQVVIFIKDTDGDIAKEKLGQYVGRYYEFDKCGNFDTKITRKSLTEE